MTSISRTLCYPSCPGRWGTSWRSSSWLWDRFPSGSSKWTIRSPATAASTHRRRKEKETKTAGISSTRKGRKEIRWTNYNKNKNNILHKYLIHVLPSCFTFHTTFDSSMLYWKKINYNFLSWQNCFPASRGDRSGFFTATAESAAPSCRWWCDNCKRKEEFC